MKRRIVARKMLTLLLISILPVAFDIQPVKTEPATWTVDDDGPADFHTLQAAINAATPRDVIQVAAGTYYEHVLVNKTVSLIGESKSNTLIDGGGTGTVLRLTANNVTVTGFSIENAGKYDWHAGIHLDRCNNSVINKNNFQNSYYGIFSNQSSGNSILLNTMDQNLRGISLFRSDKNNVSGNRVSNNLWVGIEISGNENTVIENTVLSNELGISLSGSSNNTLKNNNMTGNGYNFSVDGGWLSHFINDIDTSNTVDGKHIYYLINQKDLTINPTTFPAIGYIGLVNSTNIKVMDVNIAKEGQGILFAQTSNSIIQNVSLSYNSRAIMLAYYSEYNIVSNNTMSNNNLGIFLGHRVSNNIIRGNTLLNSSITLLMWAVNNTFYYNNLFNSSVEITASMHAHIWNYDYPFGGNHWSDYTGVDLYCGPYQNETGSDGLGDTPYIIDVYNKDNYPLMKPRNPDISPPIAHAGSNLTVYMKDKATFNANSSTDDVGIVAYEWDFGDGTFGTGIVITHAYSYPGTYTATLTVKDIFGNIGTDSITVTVLQGEAFPSWIVIATLVAAVIGVAIVLTFFWRRRKYTQPKNEKVSTMGGSISPRSRNLCL